MSPDLPSPWREFLEELDGLLDEPFELHCIGGFAVVAGYGLPRSTNDLDYRTLVPYNRIEQLQQVAGPGSALAQKHNLYLQYTAAAESMPESYDERLTELCPGQFEHLRLFIPDPYDLALSKLGRNIDRDRQDVDFLAKSQHLDPEVLRERYTKELRPIMLGVIRQHDITLELWIEAYFNKYER